MVFITEHAIERKRPTLHRYSSMYSTTTTHRYVWGAIQWQLLASWRDNNYIVLLLFIKSRKSPPPPGRRRTLSLGSPRGLLRSRLLSGISGGPPLSASTFSPLHLPMPQGGGKGPPSLSRFQSVRPGRRKGRPRMGGQRPKLAPVLTEEVRWSKS